MGQSGEDPAGCAAGRFHSASHDCNQGQISLQIYKIRLNRTVDSGYYRLLIVHELILMHKNRHGINAGRHVFKRDSILFKNIKHFSAEADFGVHHGFFNIYGTEPFFTCNTRDNIFGFAAGAFHYQSAGILGFIGVSDVDWNTFLAYREDCILMENAGSHIGKLTKLPVCNRFDWHRILHEARIGHQESGHIGPVFVDIGVNGLRYNGACDV